MMTFLGVFAEATASPGLIEGSGPERRVMMEEGNTFLRTWTESSRHKTPRCREWAWQNINKKE